MTDSDPTRHEDSGHPPRANSDQDGRAARQLALRNVGLGMELAAFTLVFTGVGYWIDSSGDHEKPLATALATLVGFTLGMIRFIRQVTSGKDKQR